MNEFDPFESYTAQKANATTKLIFVVGVLTFAFAIITALVICKNEREEREKDEK